MKKMITTIFSLLLLTGFIGSTHAMDQDDTVEVRIVLTKLNTDCLLVQATVQLPRQGAQNITRLDQLPGFATVNPAQEYPGQSLREELWVNGVLKDTVIHEYNE